MNEWNRMENKNEIHLEQRTDHCLDIQLSLPSFLNEMPSTLPLWRKVWKSSALLFWVLLTLNNAINPALPWKRAWGDNIQSHHQSSQLYQDRAWCSPESSFMEKYNQASLWGAAPRGTFVSLPWEERNSPWAAINWHSRHGVMCLIECSEK